MSFIPYCAGCGHPISVIESWDGIGKKHVRVVVHEWSDKRNHKWNQQNCQYCACDKPEESEAGK